MLERRHSFRRALRLSTPTTATTGSTRRCRLRRHGTIEPWQPQSARPIGSSRTARGIILRFGAFYGPDALQVEDMVRFVRKGWVPLPGRPESFISPVAHDDAASAVVAVLEAESGFYNVV